MARLVRIPQGYGKAFRAKKPEPLRVQSTSPFVDVTAQDIMNMITVADKVGKSEAVGAIVGGIEEGVEAIADRVAADSDVVTRTEKTVDKVGPGAAVSKPQELQELTLIDDPTAPGAPPPSAPVMPPAGGVPTPPPSPARQVREAAKKRAASKIGMEDVQGFLEIGRRLETDPRFGKKAQIAPGPRAPRTPQAPPAPTPKDVPGPETTRGTPARGAVDVSRPTAKGMRTAALRAGTTAGEQAAREVARETPADAAPVTSLEGFIKKYSKKPTGKPVRKVQERPVERELTFKEFVAQKPTAPAVVVPEKVSYRQLLSLARKARTPEDQANILGAYDRASGKSRPRTLVERYNRAHEQRDIDRLTKFFPAIKKQATAAEQYYKLKRAQLQEALAATQRYKQMLLREKAQLTATQEEDLRRKVEAGSPEAKVAYQFALAQQAVQAAGTSAEKARRTRELLELEKAAIAATTTQKLAAAYKQLRRGVRGKGKGKRGQKYKPLTENQEANLKYRAQQDSINAQKAMINRINKKINQKAQAQSIVNSLSDAAIMRVDPSVQGRLISQRAQAQAVLDSLKSDPEASSATLITAVAVLRNMQVVSRNELNEILRRKEAVPHQQVSVPKTGPILGPKKKPEDK